MTDTYIYSLKLVFEFGPTDQQSYTSTTETLIVHIRPTFDDFAQGLPPYIYRLFSKYFSRLACRMQILLVMMNVTLMTALMESFLLVLSLGRENR